MLNGERPGALETGKFCNPGALEGRNREVKKDSSSLGEKGLDITTMTAEITLLMCLLMYVLMLCVSVDESLSWRSESPFEKSNANFDRTSWLTQLSAQHVIHR